MSSTSPSLILPAALALLVALGPEASAEKPRGSYVRRELPLAQAEGDELPRILYLNRCEGGCVLNPGGEDAIHNMSSIVQGPSTLAAFPYGDDVWKEVVDCVREQYSRFDLNITDVDPGELPHYEAIVAGYGEDIGAFGAAGIAPAGCSPLPNSINFTFAETIGGNAREICEVIAQESGHVFGLDHALLCEDPMTYLTGCGDKEFQDIDAECGESSARACSCGNATQNSVQHLLSVFGPGNLPATADVEVLDVREDPDSSDGNAIADPGENLLIEVAVTNKGNFTSEAVSFKIKSGGRLSLIKPSTPLVLEPRKTAKVQLLAKVESSACGEQVDFDVTTKLESGTWSASSSVTAGISSTTWSSSIATDEPWTADDGSDATQGAWEYGVPEQTIFAGRVLQPAGSGDGPNLPVWMTGLNGKWDESALVGSSSLVTSDIDVSGWHTVYGLQYRLWHQALDRSNGGLDPSSDAHLTVELSKDNGKTWREIDAVIGESYRWDVREVSFPPIEVGSSVKLRFTVRNDGSVDDRLIEVGIDSITLEGGELLCTPPAGCGCSTTRSDQLAGLFWLVPMFLWLRRARRQAGAQA